MKVSPVSATSTPATIGQAVQGLGDANGAGNGSWSDIVSRVARYTNQNGLASSNPANQINQISGLIKLQMDVHRYQLRVELVSKVSESAVASMRKLQQNQ